MTWTILNFLILAAMLVYFARKPLGAMFAADRDTTKKAISEAEALRAEVEKMVTEYRRKLDNLDTEVERMLSEARAHGEREKSEILARAERLAQKILHDARLSAEKEMEKAKSDLERETLKSAAMRAAELLKERVTDREHKAFTAELIATLESRNA